MIFRSFLAIFLLFWSVSAHGQVRPSNPEAASGQGHVKTATGHKFMAVTAHPDATKAAYNVLENGGTAADAAIAAQLVLGLVEPQSSGLGGGAFVLYYDAKHKKVFSLDGRETAPSTAGAHLFTNAQGKAIPFYDAANGGRAVGVPGLLRVMERLHEWQGKTPWSDLFLPAIKLAEDGFTVSKRMEMMLRKEASRFDADVEAKLYFYPDSHNPIQAGATKQNLNYANTLNYISLNGVDSFYDGPLARNMIEKIRQNKNPGLLSIEDLKEYSVKERMPVCGDYRGYKICSMGQPSSGGLTLLNAIGILSYFDLKNMGPENPASWHVIAEASRLAFADRNYYMADPDFVETPDTQLLNPFYLKERAEEIDINKPMAEVSEGTPAGWKPSKQGKDDLLKPPGTTHISIVDGYGNMVSMTSSIENAFGARVMSDGFLLNNQLTDFAFEPNDENKMPKANRVEGGKRPRSSMAPTLIFDPYGDPFMVIGSAGGSRIIGYVLQRIISAIDWEMDIDTAIAQPNILHRGDKLEVENTGLEWAEPLKNIGHPILVGDMNSGLTAIQFKNGKMLGAADPRRDGIAMGQ